MDLLVLIRSRVWRNSRKLQRIEALLDSTHAVDAMVAEYRKRRDLFVAGLNGIPGFRCQTPGGAFYAWVNIEETGLAAEDVAKLLLEEAGVAGIAGRRLVQAERIIYDSRSSARGTCWKEALERIQRVSARWRAAVAR